MVAFAGVWGALTVMAIVTAGLSLWLHFRGEGIHELRTQVRQLALDVEDVYDRLEKWTHRAQVRAMRDGKLSAASLTPQPGSAEYKSYLRRKSRGEIQ